MIRPAVESDAVAIAALSIEVWLSTYVKRGVTPEFARYALEEYSEAKVQKRIEHTKEHLFVSQNAEGIDGYIRMTEGSACPVPGGGSTEIATLYVQPRHSGRGLGRALIATVMPYRPVWLMVNCENTAARAFYDAQSFRKIGTTEFQLGEASYTNDVMILGRQDC